MFKLQNIISKAWEVYQDGHLIQTFFTEEAAELFISRNTGEDSYAMIPSLIDLNGVQVGVEIEIKEDGSVLWVNVDGVCRLRICQIKQRQIRIADKRPVFRQVSEALTNGE